MGDNRGDSATAGTGDRCRARYIVGKVVLRIWPLSRITIF